MSPAPKEILKFVEENDVKFIRLTFSDMSGNLKNIAIMRHLSAKTVLTCFYFPIFPHFRYFHGDRNRDVLYVFSVVSGIPTARTMQEISETNLQAI